MNLFLVTVLLSFIALVTVMMTLRLSNRARWRWSAADFAEIIQAALEGGVSEQRWQWLLAAPIRHSENLEAIRQRCLALQPIVRTACQAGEPSIAQLRFTERDQAELSRILQFLAAEFPEVFSQKSL